MLDWLNTFRKILPSQPIDKRGEYLRREAKIGGQLFGPVPKGHQRDFFCLDDTTWIWNESWTDGNGRLVNLQTRYDLHESGIIKHQNGAQVPIGISEMINLLKAMHQYNKAVATQLYPRSLAGTR